MSNDDNKKKKTALNLKSASFIPKASKPKSNEEEEQKTQPSNSSNNRKGSQYDHVETAPYRSMGFVDKGIHPTSQPIQLHSVPNTLKNMMGFPGIIDLQMNMNNAMSSFSPMKPPPLLFSPPENIMMAVHPGKNIAPSEPKKIKVISYTAEFMISFRDKYKVKPSSMKQLEFPHKSKTLKSTYLDDDSINPFNKKQQKTLDFNVKVLKLREWLNKLTKKNYNKISKFILTKFQYTPQLLKELIKIIFIKATTETNFIKLYVDLSEQLFKKFNDKENVEMNFKKLMLKKWQKEFYKDKLDEADQDFSKGSLYVFDEEEIEYQNQQKVFGNLKLIGELYCRGYVNDKVIIEWIEFLMKEPNDESIEAVWQILSQVSDYVLFDKKRAKTVEKKSIKGDKVFIKYDWLNDRLLTLMSLIKDSRLSSRIRFKVQDIIDNYNKTWDDRIKTLMGIEVIKKDEPKNENSSISNKTSAKTTNDKEQLFSGIRAAFGITEDDEDYKREVYRKVSVNENNVVGLNFQKYQDMKPSQQIRIKIYNFVDEYNSSEENKEQALENMKTTRTENDLEGYFFVGYALQYSFSMDQAGFEHVYNLLIEFHEHGYLENEDLVEGLNVSVSNYADSLIDYPKTKDYVIHILESLHDMKLISSKSMEKYKEHIEKIENNEYEY